MRNENLPLLIERELAKSGKEIFEVSSGIFTTETEVFKDINTVIFYDSRNKFMPVLCNTKEVEELRKHLIWLYSKGGINSMYIETKNNPEISSAVIGIKRREEIDSIMDFCKSEIEQERYPVKYSFGLCVNVNKLAKWKSLLR
ncbi:Uncharacterised protein [uncultured archaeon]|nr:Uncharacterised protein [uncultured archaeon]